MCVCVRERERARSGRQRIGKRNIGKVGGRRREGGSGMDEGIQSTLVSLVN